MSGQIVRSGFAPAGGHDHAAADQDQHGADDQPGETLAAGVRQESAVVTVAIAVAVAVTVAVAVAVVVVAVSSTSIVVEQETGARSRVAVAVMSSASLVRLERGRERGDVAF